MRGGGGGRQRLGRQQHSAARAGFRGQHQPAGGSQPDQPGLRGGLQHRHRARHVDPCVVPESRLPAGPARRGAPARRNRVRPGGWHGWRCAGEPRRHRARRRPARRAHSVALAGARDGLEPFCRTVAKAVLRLSSAQTTPAERPDRGRGDLGRLHAGAPVDAGGGGALGRWLFPALRRPGPVYAPHAGGPQDPVCAKRPHCSLQGCLQPGAPDFCRVAQAPRHDAVLSQVFSAPVPRSVDVVGRLGCLVPVCRTCTLFQWQAPSQILGAHAWLSDSWACLGQHASHRRSV